MISCGEPSGDLYAGALVSALRTLAPSVSVAGFGGARLEAAGATLLGDYRGFSVTGLVEALSVLPRSWRMLKQLGAAARDTRPNVFVAIDFPDFNFRLLPVMKRLGIPVVYYVSPQLWAWRPRRLETIRKYVDRMLVIFPFESAIYEQAGIPVEFVGHPLVELADAAHERPAFLRTLQLDPARPVIALLPGSRPNEVTQILPGLVGAARLVVQQVREAQFLVARAPSLDDALFEPLQALRAAGVRVEQASGATDDVLAAADVVVTASGTATVQSAIHGRPMVIVYRLAPLTYRIGRSMVKVETYGMVNLVAGRRIVPELIQDAFTPENVARETVSLLTDSTRADTMRQDLADVRTRLGGRGASQRAAAAILQLTHDT